MPARQLDLDELTTRVSGVAGAWRPGCSIDHVRALTGGSSGLTYAATLAGRPGKQEVVIKVAPAGVPPTLNRDVLRQARLLRAIGDAPGVRVPEVLFEGTGDPPDVPPFFVMTHVRGDSFEPINDDEALMPSPAEISARAHHAARMLAFLHAVDPVAVGLGDEPVSRLETEVERWRKLLSTLDEALRPGSEDAAAALLTKLPDELPSVVTHGDYRLGNTLCADGEVQAIIDWEIWSRGDPRIDLSWFLTNAHPSTQPTAIREAPGMPSADDLLHTYEVARGVVVADLGWFRAFTWYKSSATMGLIIKHNRRRPEPDTTIESWAATLPGLIAGAIELAG